jgi:phosphoribosylaminoimidazole-succinocarboxamide synthase
MTNVLLKTSFTFPGQKSLYKGKVRDVYNINDQFLVMVASDRISAFDVVLPRGIPYKGQVLNQIAAKFLDATADICPNWKVASPDPNVTIGRFCKIYPVEMIIRGYLTGSSWRTYQKGAREICGVPVPDGMKEHQRFPEPIITPTTKAVEGHDEDITEKELLAQGLIPAEEYELIRKYTYALFERGTRMAAGKGLILVDTKYEFGKGPDGKIYLCDEIHTPDSSRYFYLEGYEERQSMGEQQRQLSKEFVREWLMANGFMGKEGQQVPDMSDTWIGEISDRYIELYEGITGEKFVRAESGDILRRIELNVLGFLNSNQ